MKRKLLFTKAQEKIALKVYLFIWLLLSLNVTAFKAQTSKVVPETNTSGTFLGPYTNTARTYQMIIDDSQLTTLSGKYITSIEFRLPGSATASWPASNATFPSYEVFLSNGVDPADRQLNFAANVVGTQTKVRTGSLLIPTGSLTSGSDPNAFGYVITFDTPWLYNGTNLVIEMRHTGSNVNSTSTHAATTSASGYGTLFTACWQGTGSVLQGNFSFVKINSVDALGVRSAEIGAELSVYPNPAKEFIYIKSGQDMVEFHVFSMAGQKVFSHRNTSKTSQLNVSGLSKGSYILQMIDKNGNSHSTKFIKE